MGAITVIGCDPGSTGALCLLKIDPTKQPEVVFCDLNLSPMGIHDWLSQVSSNGDIRIAMMEDVRSMFGMSAKSNFSFGKNIGIIQTLLELQSFGLDLVKAKEWQKYAGVNTRTKGTDIKKAVAEIATRLYPMAEIYGPKGGLKDGRADALMIAHYAAHKYK